MTHSRSGPRRERFILFTSIDLPPFSHWTFPLPNPKIPRTNPTSDATPKDPGGLAPPVNQFEKLPPAENPKDPGGLEPPVNQIEKL